MTSPANFEVLTYDNPAEREKWRALCQRFKDIDIFYYPEYAYLFQLKGDGQACCFYYYEASDRIVIYPFLIRYIKEIQIDNCNDGNAIDIMSPYGYNGYLACTKEMAMGGFFRTLHNYCNQNQVVSELIRFHPIISNHDYCQSFIPIQKLSEVIVIDLTLDLDTIWHNFEPSCRNKIRKARKNYVKIIIDEDYKNLAEFYKLYIGTMQRLKALGYYYFSREWFESLLHLLPSNIALFHAQLDAKIIMSGIFLFTKDFIHYFLSGSDYAFNNLGANNLMLYKVAEWAKTRGIKYFNLGGGVQGQDSLFKFKASFSPLRKTFCVGNVIHDQEYYQYLCDLKLAAESNQPLDVQFFPFYRAPKLNLAARKHNHI